MTSVPENELALAQLQNSHLSPVLPVVFSEYRIVAHRESGRLIHVGKEKINDADITPVTFFQLKNFPDHVFLTALEQFVPLHAVGDPRVSTILAYECIEVDHGKFALRQPFTKKIFCIGAPNEQDRTGIIECNRDWVGAWEHLEWVIDPAQPPVCDPLLEHIVRAMTSTRPLDERGLDLSTPRRTDALLAALTCSMTSEEAVEGAKKQILNLPWHKQETFLSL